MKVENEYVLYRAPNLPFTEKTRETLLEAGVNQLYISNKDRKFYQNYVESELNNIINDKTIDDASKSAVIYDSAKLMVKDLMDKPSLPENMHRSMALVESTALYLLKTQDTFHSMLKTMSFDYSTYTHSVNVCTYALALANKIDMDNKEKLLILGTGALLHDIGKSRVPTAILEKNGFLNESEMEVVKRHPQYGFEIVINSEIIPHDAHYPILQHHEREDGTGYPHGLKSQDIHFYSKIVAIADVFDAMTTERTYRNAKGAYPTLSEMYANADSFDRDLLKEFTLLMGPGSTEGSN
jgi:putative nucleotidyltransferase with HDIG domain